ncbi:MAG: phosphoribosylglycinamide formyltransferase [Alphaproteobacteria bacterium]
MAVAKINLAVLISGSGSNLQALIDACAKPDYPAKINVVISNRPNAYGLKRAEKAGIPAEIVDHTKYANRIDFESVLQNVLGKYPVDLICLAGFMRILTPEFVARWQGRIINTHPALLPKHGGKGMFGEHVHKSVLAAGDAESGVSIHYVIPEVDRGEIILQRRVKVEPGDTYETLAARVLAEEHIAYEEAVRMIAEKKQKQA